MTNLTLITGDTVTVVDRDGNRSYIVSSETSYQKFATPDGTYIIPQGVDLRKFDLDLFNVDLLLEQGVADNGTSRIPVMVESVSRSDSSTGLRLAAEAARSAPGTTVTARLESVQSAAAIIEADDAAAAYASLESDQSVERVHYDATIEPANDEATAIVGADAARREYNASGEGVTVAVIDTGIDESHPDIDQVALQKDFSGVGHTNDTIGHGTHVAGTIAGDGTVSDGQYMGVAPNASLMDLKVFDGGGTTSSSIIDAMEHGVDNNADVLSMSLGGTPTRLRSNGPFSDAVDYAHSNGVVVVASAGNDGPYYGTVGTPGVTEHAITVGATDKQGGITSFSSRGPTPYGFFVKPTVVAPGSAVTSTASSDSPYSGDYTSMSGTSMAAPVVSGTVALMLEENPSQSPTQVKNTLVTTADSLGPQDVYTQGAGRINATDALDPTIVVDSARVDFGAYEESTLVSKNITVTNHGDSTETLNVSVAAENIIESTGSNVSVNQTTMTLDPGESQDLQLTVDTSTGAGVYSGRISFDQGEYTAIFGYTRFYNVTVTKSPYYDTGVVDGDVVHFFADQPESGSIRGAAATKVLDNGSVSYGFFDSGTYHVQSAGVAEQDDVPIVVAKTVQIDESKTITLDESNSVTHRLDRSALTDREGPVTVQQVIVDYRQTDDWGYEYSGEVYATRPAAGVVRSSANSNLDLSIQRVVVPDDSLASPGAYNTSSLYVLVDERAGVTGPTVHRPTNATLVGHDATYHRVERSDSYNVTIGTRTTQWYDPPTAVYGGIGDRLHQTIYVSEGASFTVGAFDGAARNPAWRLLPMGSIRADHSYDHSFELNTHPFASSLGVWNLDNSYFWMGAYWQSDDGYPPRVVQSRDGLKRAAVIINDQTILERNWTDGPVGVSAFGNGLNESDEVAFRLEANNSNTRLSNRTVTRYNATYEVGTDNAPPTVGGLTINRLNETNVGPNGDFSMRFYAYDGETSVDDVTVYVATGSPAETPFTDATNWTKATVTSPFEGGYAANADISTEYFGNVSIAIQVQDAAGNAVQTTVFNATRVGEKPPDAIISANRTQPLVVNETVRFDGSNSWDNDDITDYEWTVENATDATRETVTRSWSTPGVYNLTLNVTDTKGKTDEVTRPIVVQPDTVAPAVTAISPANESTLPHGTNNATLELAFADQHSDVDTENITVAFDGEAVTENATINATTLTYNATGLSDGSSHLLTANVPDTKGNTATYTLAFDVAESSSSGGGGGGGQGDDEQQAKVNIVTRSDGVKAYMKEVPFGAAVTLPLDSAIQSEKMSVDSVTVDFMYEEPSQVRLEISDVRASPSGTPELKKATPIGYLEMQSFGFGASRVRDVSVKFTVRRDALLAETAAEDVSLYAYRNGAWRTVGTNQVAGTTYKATVDGFPPLAVGVRSDAAMTEAVTPTVTTEDSTPPEGSDRQDDSQTSTDSPGFGSLLTIVALAVAFVVMRRI